MSTAADREERREIVKFLNRVETAWTSGRMEELRSCFLEAAVLMSPDLEQRILELEAALARGRGRRKPRPTSIKLRSQ